MPTYKLTYFNARARAEGIRWIFAQAGVEYEDYRIPKEDVASHDSADTPFSKLPVIEIDGKILSQNETIGRYLANQFGLAGKTAWEKALADQFVDVIDDIFSGLRIFFWEQDEEKKAALRKTFLEETAPIVLSKYETFLASNPSGFLVGESLTWADLFFGAYMENIEDRVKPEFGALVDNYPNIRKNLAKIRSLPKIAAWIKSRPDNPF